MGRRKKSNDGGGAILLLALAVFAAIFIIKLTTTIVFYCLLPALGIVWVATWRPTGPKVPFQPTAFDNQESWREIQRLCDQRRAAFKYLNKQYETGFAQNLTLTAKSQETMFHAGSRLGKQLNANLEAGFSDLRNLSAKIQQLRSDVVASFPDWQRPISHWIWLKRLNVTSGSGLVTGVMSATILWSTALIPTSISEYAGKALLWDPYPALEKGPLVVAACLTAFLTAGAWVATGETHWKEINENAIREWEDLENKWHYPIEDEIFEINAEAPPSSDDRDQERPDYQSANPDPWYTVLGISPNSTDDEIKRAYREAIKQYHPDKVSTLGVRLRDVAEEESRRINEAFSNAKAARGFV